MKKQIFSTLVFAMCLILPFSVYSQEQRKKVGVVLSGGGAKGVAHIKALKVIEEAGIPIDYIVGTSMGSIVGGLYAIGYTPEYGTQARLDFPFERSYQTQCHVAHRTRTLCKIHCFASFYKESESCHVRRNYQRTESCQSVL